MKRAGILILLAATVMVSCAATAQNAINQSELLYYDVGAFESALGTASGGLHNSVSAGMNNPAALASIQQLKISSMFGDIMGGSRYIHLGSAIPTSRGVLGLSLRYFAADSGSALDQAWGGNVIWAKNFTDNLFVGVGLQFFEMYYGPVFKPQIAGNAGAIYSRKIDYNRKFKTHFNSWSVGLSVLNAGNWLTNNSSVVSMPFQIKVGPGIDFTLLPGYEIRLAADLVYVNLNRLRVNVGMENRILDHLYLNAGYLFNSGLNSMSFGASYKFNIRASEGRISALVLPYLNGDVGVFAGIDWAFGSVDQAPPKVEFELEEGSGSDQVYISPNYDGKQDVVNVGISIKDNKALRSWKVEIVDEKGETVRKFVSQDNRTLSGKWTAGKMFTRMFEKQKEVTVPQKILWDGKGETGQMVPDGTYRIFVEAMDENKNSVRSAPKTIVIDTVMPKAELKADLTLFSPNGVKSNLVITQNATKKADWTAMVLDSAGKPVRTISWKDSVPGARFIWNGTDDSGNPCPNGVYSYVLAAKDKAGNTVEKKLVNISLVTDRQSVSVDADAVIFSPNSDGYLDAITFSPILTSYAGISNWQLKIMDGSRNAVKTFMGRDKPPARIIWEGTDDNDGIPADGNYFYVFKADYFNGDRPVSFPKGLKIDDTPPKLEFVLSTHMLSPDGGGKDEVLFFSTKVQDSSEIREWKLEIRDEQNKVVKVFSGQGDPATEIAWFGMREDGALVKGGEIYSAILTVVDIAGNKSVSAPEQIKVNAQPPEVEMRVKNQIFSPDGDGDADMQEISFTRYDSKTLKEWSLQLLLVDREKKTETAVKTWTGTELPPVITWDGTSDDGSLAVRGGQILKVKYDVSDILGNRTNIKSQFAVDSTPPNVGFKLNPQMFSPDDDGQNDVEYISFMQKDGKKLKDWRVDIYPLRDDKRESLFKTFSGQGPLPSAPLEWDGNGDKGGQVESAQDYDVELTVSDVLNNVTKAMNILNVDILVIKTQYGLKIKISNIGFQRDSSEVKDDRTFKILNKVAKIVAKYRTYKVEIQGHTSRDSAASGEEYNQKLSEARAGTVMKYLVKQGLQADQLRSRGMGFNMPAVENTTEENKAKNRRVEFLLFKEGWPPEPVQTNQSPSTNTTNP